MSTLVETPFPAKRALQQRYFLSLSLSGPNVFIISVSDRVPRIMTFSVYALSGTLFGLNQM
jgi:hypothetical protein